METDKIFNELTKWVSLRGNGRFFEQYPNIPPHNQWILQEDYGIQQVESEIVEFLKVISPYAPNAKILEIGLGQYGSTHFLWRHFFKKVITIEKSSDRIRDFGTNLRSYYGEWVLGDEKSAFIYGLSSDPQTVKKVYDLLVDGIDILFIDGDHKYASVLSDFLLYSPLVRKGGIVAFHDSACKPEGYSDVPVLIEKLAAGKIDGLKYNLIHIEYSNICGISYFIK